MRAALLTTTVVIAALAIWASVREPNTLRDVSAAAAPRNDGEPTPDVAAPAPQPPVSASNEPAEEPSYETATEPPAPAPREHRVAEGETLATIAERYYGDASRADAIYQANRDQIRDPAQLHAGQILVLP